ncbi:MAG: transposase, partial [Bacteroidetes bacterium]|nr:transposase [Bacteroidota bacterium]
MKDLSTSRCRRPYLQGRIANFAHTQKSLSDVLRQVKGASSHALNDTNLCPFKFIWQCGYGAFAVRESAVEIVRNY